MTFMEMPDIEAVCSKALNAEGLRSYSSVPKTPTYPLVTVQRLGGAPAERHKLDAARIQVDSWGTNKAEARDLAEQARRILHESEGERFEDDEAFITGVDDELGLSFLPDPDTKRDRYTFAVMVYAYHVDPIGS